eukprot:TRINITY_DN88531_c2_g1_i1.p1 TRINITY_DN88531_c2_g1~~TRINITY_DN88531_c2_g1_i1.p1  ORF type:complete len:840 (+),score=144.91 TRINITY_DN88531_c2_g1_i1:312-2831(+)
MQDGVIKLEEFTEYITEMLGGVAERTSLGNDVTDQKNLMDGLTIEKLADIKAVFQEVRRDKGNNVVLLEDLRKKGETAGIIEEEFNEVFKDFLIKRQDKISQSEFDTHLAKVEKNLLELCLDHAKISEEPSYQVNSAVFFDYVSPSQFQMPKEGEDNKGQTFGIEDYTLDEYLTTLKEMLEHALTADNYARMPPEELRKTLKDLSEYVKVAKKKGDTLEEYLKSIKNELENKEDQEGFLQNKIRNYQDTIDEIQAAKDNMEKEVERMFSIEQAYEKLKDRNAELDRHFVESSDEINTLKSHIGKLERELRQVKRNKDEVSRELMDAKSDKAELLTELDKLSKDYEDTKAQLKAEINRAKLGSEKPLSEPKLESEITMPVEEKASTYTLQPAITNVKEKAETEGKQEQTLINTYKKESFELKKRIDILQDKIDVTLLLLIQIQELTDENTRLQNDTEKYITELHQKSSKIQQLEITCKELEEEAAHLTMRLRNIDFIQAQDDKIQPALRMSYAKALIETKTAPFVPTRFEPVQEVIVPEKPHIIDEEEENSLAKQLGINEAGFAAPKDLAKITGEDKKEEEGEAVKIRESNLFQLKKHFKDKNISLLEAIPERTSEVPKEEKKVVVPDNPIATILKEKFIAKIKPMPEIPRASKITNFDFLNLKRNPKISKLPQLKEESFFVFTEYIYVISPVNLDAKCKKILYLTSFSLFILHATSFQIEKVAPITDLKAFVFIKSSGILTVLNFNKAQIFYARFSCRGSLLFETYRRTELLIFLAQQFKQRNYRMFQVAYSNKQFGAVKDFSLDQKRKKAKKLTSKRPRRTQRRRNCGLSRTQTSKTP